MEGGSRAPAEQVVRTLFGCFAARDVEGALPLLHEDFELWPQPTAERAGRATPYRGHAGWREYLADVERVWAEFSVDPNDLRVAGEGVICFGTARGRAHDGGPPLEQQVVWVIRLRAGRVVLCRVVRTAGEAEAVAAGRDPAGGAQA